LARIDVRNAEALGDPLRLRPLPGSGRSEQDHLGWGRAHRLSTSRPITRANHAERQRSGPVPARVARVHCRARGGRGRRSTASSAASSRTEPRSKTIRNAVYFPHNQQLEPIIVEATWIIRGFAALMLAARRGRTPAAA
jgi:hypothetical protein